MLTNRSLIPSPALLALSTALLFSTTAAAQRAAFDLLAHGNYGTYATQGTASDLEFVADQRQIPMSLALSAFLAPAGGVDTIAGFNTWPGGIATVDISEQGAVSVAAHQSPFVGGSTKSDGSGRLVPAPHEMLLSIHGTPGARGLIEAWSTGVLDRGVLVSYAVDVDNDRRAEFKSALPQFTTAFIPVTIPRSGTLLVRLSSEVVVKVPAGSSVRYKTGLSLRYSPAPACAVRSYGEACGPTLSGRFIAKTTRPTFRLDFANATPNSHGLIIFGTRELHLPLPGTTCPLLTDPHIVVGFRTDAHGAATWTYAVPANQAVDVKLQAADLGGRQLATTNALHVLCLL